MASFQKRIVDKWLADRLEEELRRYREEDANGAATIFGSLAQSVRLNPNDLERVEKQMESEMKRRRRAANLPERWRDVRAALVGKAPEVDDEDYSE